MLARHPLASDAQASLQRNVVVFLPRVFDGLVTQHVQRAADTLAGGAFPDVQPGRAVNELWEEHYLLVCSVAREIAESEGEPHIENIDALDADLLAGHPVYGWARKSLQRMAAALAWCDFEPAFLTEMKSSSRISHAPPRGFSSSTSSWLARGVPSGPSGRFSRVRFNG